MVAMGYSGVQWAAGGAECGRRECAGIMGVMAEEEDALGEEVESQGVCCSPGF